MKRRLAVFCVFAAAMLLGFTASALSAPQERGKQLFDVFLKCFHPQTAKMVLSSQPREDGRIPLIYIAFNGAEVAGMRVDQTEMIGYEVQATPPALWPKMEHPEIKSMLACNGWARVTEKDLNNFLKTRSFGKDGEWDKIRVRFENSRIVVSCYYLADLKLFKLWIKLELATTLGIHNNSELWLENTELWVNNAEVPLSLLQRGIEHIQPILNLKDFMLPVELSEIIIKDGSLIVTSRRPVKPFSGLTWQYPNRERPVK